ncbi:MAG: histone deacetylase [Bacteroidetes bacterium]|nr:histone deacetylase [Bacteroidota bacterium]
MIRIAHHSIYAHPLPEGHRFPMLKYEMLPEQLVREGTCQREQFFAPNRILDKHIIRTHSTAYYKQLKEISLTKKEVRRIGFPLSEELIDRECIIAQGTLEGCEFALKNNISFNIAGGTHHAFFDRGEAFCLLNDQAIAANYLLATGKATQILIVDLDVHQGNGTAALFRNNPNVFTFSMHGKANYPFQKEISDLDIPLEDNTEDNEYLNILALQLTRLFSTVQPDFVFYLSGVDVLKEDKLGRLALSLEGAKKRDEMVLSSCFERNIPVQCSMGGGYAPDVNLIIEAHANTYRVAAEIFE